MATRREKVTLAVDGAAMYAAIFEGRRAVVRLIAGNETVWRGQLRLPENDMPWQWEGDDS